MVKSFFASVIVTFVCATSFVAATHAPFHHLLSKRVHANGNLPRQWEWEPIIAQCPTECAVLEQAFGACKTSQCICTDAVAAGFRECMLCSINLVQNPGLLKDAQESLDEFEENCSSDGYSVAPLSIVVAAPTDQPPPAHPAESTSWSIPGTRTVILPPPTGAPQTPPSQPSPYFFTMWTSSDSFGMAASWSGAWPAGGGTQTFHLPAPSGSAGSQGPSDPSFSGFGDSSGSTTVSVSIPGSGTTITFVSPTTTPSDPGDLNQKVNLGMHLGPSVAAVAGVVVGVLLLMIQAL